MLEMNGQSTGSRDHSPLIIQYSGWEVVQFDHRLDGESHPSLQPDASSRRAVVRDLWILM